MSLLLDHLLSAATALANKSDSLHEVAMSCDYDSHALVLFWLVIESCCRHFSDHIAVFRSMEACETQNDHAIFIV